MFRVFDNLLVYAYIRLGAQTERQGGQATILSLDEEGLTNTFPYK